MERSIEQHISTVLEVARQNEHNCNRGGVSRLVAGPAAGSYCYLLDSYRADGAQPNIGAHQVGTIINGIPLFKVPSSIIPNNRMLSVFKNEANEADIYLDFGTLVPFYATGTIVRKNQYKEAAIKMKRVAG